MVSERPQEVTCADCKTTYPNERYPQNKSVEVDAPGGKHRFPYYEEGGVRRFFGATADYRARRYLAQQAQDLGRLYQATGEERYAWRAYLILTEFARAFFPAIRLSLTGNGLISPFPLLPITARKSGAAHSIGVMVILPL